MEGGGESLRLKKRLPKFPRCCCCAKKVDEEEYLRDIIQL